MRPGVARNLYDLQNQQPISSATGVAIADERGLEVILKNQQRAYECGHVATHGIANDVYLLAIVHS